MFFCTGISSPSSTRCASQKRLSSRNELSARSSRAGCWGSDTALGPDMLPGRAPPSRAERSRAEPRRAGRLNQCPHSHHGCPPAADIISLRRPARRPARPPLRGGSGGGPGPTAPGNAALTHPGRPGPAAGRPLGPGLGRAGQGGFPLRLRTLDSEITFLKHFPPLSFKGD